MPVAIAENAPRFARKEESDLLVARATRYDAFDLFKLCVRAKLRSLVHDGAPLITEEMVKKEFEEPGASYRTALAIKFARAVRESDPELGLLKLTKRGSRVGCMILSMEDNGQWLSAVSVAKTKQGQGHGAYMLSTAIERAQGLPLHLEALDYNQRAIGLYKKMGFEPTGEERPGYRFDDVQTTMIRMTHPGV